jgi:hypothetical protein
MKDIPRMPPFRAYLTCLQLLFLALLSNAMIGPPRPEVFTSIAQSKSAAIGNEIG